MTLCPALKSSRSEKEGLDVNMGSLAEDIVAVYLLVIEHYRRLRTLDPGNELLKYVTVREDDSGFAFCHDDAIWREFLQRFVQNGDRREIEVLANYDYKMRSAITGLERRCLDKDPA